MINCTFIQLLTSMKYITQIPIIAALMMITFSCSPQSNTGETTDIAVKASERSAINNDQFKDYWYQGKAELTSYKLEQARYGEIHQGHAVTIFVTEDFSKSKQVKLDNPQQAGNDRVPILKLNLTKKFNTGIYPYSLMQSVFTPVDIQKYPHTLKTTMSSQEWCGHTFTQLNLKKNGYHFSGRSYFESEGDEDKNLDMAILEDELWTRIRINPHSLPTGNHKLIPASFYTRLLHKDNHPTSAKLSLKEEGDAMVYHIEYEDLARTLTIRFEKDFPWQIRSWEETTGTVFGNQSMTTKATRMKSMMGPYWNQHNNEHLPLRNELMLP